MRCTLCKNRYTTIWEGSKKDIYLYCKNCGLIYRELSNHLEPPEEKKRYLLHNNSMENRGYISYLNNFIDSALLPAIKKGDRILDFGSGPEPCLTNLLQNRGFSVISYDPFFTEPISWSQNCFDNVVALEVFEHLRKPRKEIEQIAGVIKSGGNLIIRTVLHDESYSNFMTWWYKEDKTHVSFYSEKSIDYICRRWNFELAKINNNCEVTLRKK